MGRGFHFKEKLFKKFSFATHMFFDRNKKYLYSTRWGGTKKYFLQNPYNQTQQTVHQSKKIQA